MALDVASLPDRAREGDVRALGRLISLVENGDPALREILAAFRPHAGRAAIVGLTGAPGVGKSTMTSALVRSYRQRGSRVAVLAVDPSSPFSGGALLGDRVRMQEHATDRDVFIRSMSSRGHLGGLAAAAGQALTVMDGAGYDVLLVETVGVGQSEVEVASLADTTVVVAAPGMGDAIQAAKAGILEVGDVFVINKADREGAAAALREMRGMISLAGPWEGWRPPVVSTVAERAEGLGELLEELDKHAAWLTSSGERLVRQRRRVVEEVSGLARGTLLQRLRTTATGQRLDDLAGDVLAGRLDPYAAADTLVTDACG